MQPTALPSRSSGTNRHDLYPRAIAKSGMRENSFAPSTVFATLITRESSTQVPAPLPRSSGQGLRTPAPR